MPGEGAGAALRRRPRRWPTTCAASWPASRSWPGRSGRWSGAGAGAGATRWWRGCTAAVLLAAAGRRCLRCVAVGRRPRGRSEQKGRVRRARQRQTPTEGKEKDAKTSERQAGQQGRGGDARRQLDGWRTRTGCRWTDGSVRKNAGHRQPSANCVARIAAGAGTGMDARAAWTDDPEAAASGTCEPGRSRSGRGLRHDASCTLWTGHTDLSTAWRSAPTANASSPAAVIRHPVRLRSGTQTRAQQLFTLKGPHERGHQRGFQPRRQTHRHGMRRRRRTGPFRERSSGTRTRASELLSLKGTYSAVTSVAFSPDGKRIVSRRASDKTAEGVGRRATGQEVLSLKGHTERCQQRGVQPRRQTHRLRRARTRR